MVRDLDRHFAESPEPKLELVDGRLTIGNSLAGSRWTLHDLLMGYGARGAMPFAEEPSWLAATRRGFGEFDPPAADKPLSVWQAWAAQISYQPRIEPAGPRGGGPHYDAATRLRMDLYAACEESGLGMALGRDIVMRLRDDGLTPDVLLVRSERLSAWHDSFLNGPADLVVEVTLPGHEAYDRDVKRRLYRAGGVQEYWIIDPESKTVELLRLGDGSYRPQHPDADGVYRPAGIPSLEFFLGRLWKGEGWGQGPKVVAAKKVKSGRRRWKANPSAVGWGALPFHPAPALEPSRLRFDEYVAWTPPAKFEMIEGRPLLGGSIGTRHVFGMLLRTFGLAESVRLLHPSRWIEALLDARLDRTTDGERRKALWSAVRRAANLLRENGYERVTVIGDFVGPDPLHVWTDVTLVTQGGPKSLDWDLMKPLSRLLGGLIWDVREWDRLSKAQVQELEGQGVEV